MLGHWANAHLVFRNLGEGIQTPYKSLPTASSSHALNYFVSVSTSPFWPFHINRFIQCMACSTVTGFFHLACFQGVSISQHISAIYSFLLPNIHFIHHSSADGHLVVSIFRLLCIMQISVCIYIFISLAYTPRDRITGS